MHQRRIARWFVALVALLLSVQARGSNIRHALVDVAHAADPATSFSRFWSDHDGRTMLGAAVTGVVFEANVPVQYYERGRLELRNNDVVLGQVGQEYTRWRVFDSSGTTDVPADTMKFQDGHTLWGPFLQFWKDHDGARMLGDPLSEAIWETVNGANIRVQYFERGRLEQPVAGSATLVVGDLGRAVAAARGLVDPQEHVTQDMPQVVVPDNAPVAAFGSIPHDEIHRPSEPIVADNKATPVLAAGGAAPAHDDGHQPSAAAIANTTVTSVPVPEGTVVQADGPTPTDSALSGAKPTAAQVAGGASIHQAAADTLPSVQPTAPLPGPTQTPSPVPTTVPPTRVPATLTPAPPSPTRPPVVRAAGKTIDVNLTKQWMYVYQDGIEVYRAPVATGKPGFETPTGTYSIYGKVPLKTMQGEENGERWVVPNVPNVMWVVGGVALHGTYWHNLFGTGVRMSHGCINLSLKDAAWLYQWASVGTPVTIHY